MFVLRIYYCMAWEEVLTNHSAHIKHQRFYMHPEQYHIYICTAQIRRFDVWLHYDTYFDILSYMPTQLVKTNCWI